jgi:predicted nucleotidyltransferase
VRDLHLHYGAGIPIQRGTEDIDFAFMVSSWSEFDALRTRLIESGACGAVEGKQHRLRHRNKLAIDLVPFGSIETENRHIAWPPKGDMVMDVFGFREAL